MMHPVSALVLTRNEEKNITRCLNSLLWADEILVVDAESTDRTREICLRPSQPWAAKVRLLTRPWTTFREQRNFALDEAKHDWVLVVDADEAVSPELATEIQKILAAEPPLKAYKVRRQEYFVGIHIRHGMWNPSYQDRFFHRAGVRYINDVHEYPLFPSPPGRIHAPIHHNPDFSVEHYMEKLNRYTTIEARDRFLQGKRTNWFHLIFTFPAMSLKSYFYYGAYKDGLAGIIISLLEGVSRVVRHIKIWQMMQEQKRSARQKLPN